MRRCIEAQPCSTSMGAMATSTSSRRSNSRSSWHSRQALTWAATLACSVEARRPVTYHGSSERISSCLPAWSRMMLAISPSQPIRQLAGQPVLEMAARVEHPRLHRVNRTVHDFGDLAITDLVKIGEIDDRAVVCRQLADRAQQHLPDLAAPHLLFGPGF